MFLFDQIPPKQFTLLSTLLGLLLTADLNENEQNSFGNFLVTVGQALLTNVSQVQTQKAFSDNQQRYDDVCRQIAQLNAQLSEMKKQIK